MDLSSCHVILFKHVHTMVPLFDCSLVLNFLWCLDQQILVNITTCLQLGAHFKALLPIMMGKQ